MGGHGLTRRHDPPRFFHQMMFGYGHVVPNVIGPGETSKFGVLGTLVKNMGGDQGGVKNVKKHEKRVFWGFGPPPKKCPKTRNSYPLSPKLGAKCPWR